VQVLLSGEVDCRGVDDRAEDAGAASLEIVRSAVDCGVNSLVSDEGGKRQVKKASEEESQVKCSQGDSRESGRLL
jgi:hypothetical protein